MGERLANEFKNYILSYCPEQCISKISLIGHSLGGLIIRAALPHLAEYSEKFHLFCTMGTPHLGYLQSQNKMLDAGLWFMKNWKKSPCLTQLSMSDQPKTDDCCLFRLTLLPGLSWFKHVILCSSYQDKYVPFESARVQIQQTPA